MTDEPTLPEMDTYRVTVERTVEIDLSEAQAAQLVEGRRDAETPEEALERVTLEEERMRTEPEEKLLGVNTEATRVSENTEEEDDG